MKPVCACHAKPGAISRRTALKGAGAMLGAAAFAKALAPLANWAREELTVEEFVQKHYRELDAEGLKQVLARHERSALEDYGAEVTIGDHRPREGVVFGYALNLGVCIGCRKCVEACHRENNHDRPGRGSYIRVLEMEKGSMDLEKGNARYEGLVPREGRFYLPVQCHQCEHPPCVDVCPVEATWREDDGIVVVDYDWCIGCRYCEAACPYHARKFNWRKPAIPKDEINPDQSYLGNRIRPAGVIEKCHFCLHRTREGRLPACLEACPTGARVFGNLLDPSSAVRKVIDHRRVYVLKEELGLKPNFFYFFD